jgi:hypothetical protein
MGAPNLAANDASMTQLLDFSPDRDLPHVSISGSVATYLIGATERRMLVRGRCFLHNECADYTSFSCCLIRSKTQPIEKCSYRRSTACAADDSMTQSPHCWRESAHLQASGCEHFPIGHVLLLVDNTERRLMCRSSFFGPRTWDGVQRRT